MKDFIPREFVIYNFIYSDNIWNYFIAKQNFKLFVLSKSIIL